MDSIVARLNELNEHQKNTVAWLGAMKTELDTANNILVAREENTNHLIDTVRNLIQENNELRETTNATLERNQRDIRALLETVKQTHAENTAMLVNTSDRFNDRINLLMDTIEKKQNHPKSFLKQLLLMLVHAREHENLSEREKADVIYKFMLLGFWAIGTSTVLEYLAMAHNKNIPPPGMAVLALPCIVIASCEFYNWLTN